MIRSNIKCLIQFSTEYSKIMQMDKYTPHTEHIPDGSSSAKTRQSNIYFKSFRNDSKESCLFIQTEINCKTVYI